LIQAVVTGAVRRVRHVKRGSSYVVLGVGEVQISKGTVSDAGWKEHKARVLREGDTLTVYRDIQDGKLWLRFPDEFEDGRFEEVK
jgi:hypothetical protein